MKLYSLESYDDDFTLKVSPGSAFWLAFLCRALVIMPFDLYFKKKSFDFMGIFYATNVHLSVAVISALPTLAVLVAWIRRHSSAGSVPRAGASRRAQGGGGDGGEAGCPGIALPIVGALRD